MKKIILLMLSILLTFTLFSCNSSQDPDSNSENPVTDETTANIPDPSASSTDDADIWLGADSEKIGDENVDETVLSRAEQTAILKMMPYAVYGAYADRPAGELLGYACYAIWLNQWETTVKSDDAQAFVAYPKSLVISYVKKIYDVQLDPSINPDMVGPFGIDRSGNVTMLANDVLGDQNLSFVKACALENDCYSVVFHQPANDEGPMSWGEATITAIVKRSTVSPSGWQHIACTKA